MVRQSEGSHPEEGGDSQQLAEATRGEFCCQKVTVTYDFHAGVLALIRYMDVTAGAIYLSSLDVQGVSKNVYALVFTNVFILLY